jgi:hypothetical protein
VGNGYGEFEIAIGESRLDDILQLKGPEQATLEKPPAHRFFDSTIISPVLQMRKDAKEAKKLTENTSAGTSDLLAGFVNLATALRTPAPIPAPHPYPLIPQNNAITTSLSLLPVNRTIGPSLDLEGFCLQFGVDISVHQKLSNEGYKTSHHLQYATVSELKEAGFRIGEIASLKDAVARWSLPSD